MADNDMSFRQHAVIEFLVKEEIPAAEIHQRLQRAYGSVCMGASSVRRWVKHFKDGNTSIQDEPSAAKVMGTVFWDAEGLILVEFLERG
jgi:truncated hemoglobin YjbI